MERQSRKKSSKVVEGTEGIDGNVIDGKRYRR